MMMFLHAILTGAAQKLLTHLIIAEEVVLPANAKLDRVVSADVGADMDVGKQARTVWVKLFVDLLRVCDGDAMWMFWECEEDGMQLRRGCGVGRAVCAVWRRCVEKVCGKVEAEDDRLKAARTCLFIQVSSWIQYT